MRLGRILRVASILLFTLVTAALGARAASAWEGNPDGSRYVTGTIRYRDGTACARCCPVSVETENGFTDTACTDDRGNYTIRTAGSSAKRVYFKGMIKWEGSAPTQGGARVDITVN